MNDKRSCDLCGMDVGAKPIYLEHAGKRLQFCCDGCLGIYQLMNGPEPSPPPDPAKAPTPKGEQP